MIKSNLFVRFALLGVLISAIMLVVSSFTTNLMRELIFDEPFRDRGPFRAIEHIIENMPPPQRPQGLADLQDRPDGPGVPPAGLDPFFDFVLLNANGDVLFPSNASERLSHLSSAKLTELRRLIVTIQTDSKLSESRGDQLSVRKLSGVPAQYLARGTRFRPPRPPMKHFAVLMSIQLLTIMIAVLLTLGAVLYSIRQRAGEAEQVIRELSQGNLKARIPITKMDEVGQVMFSFNKMADEIEHLIEHLRRTEHARRDLLRELAHDLRTPVASLKSLIETVNDRGDQLPSAKRTELLDLAMREADYFEGLVDDLLFLGRVQEPKYKTTPETIDLKDLIRHEVESVAYRHPLVSFEFDLPIGHVTFNGDAGLVKRLIRNTVENAFSFAKANVRLELKTVKDIEIIVLDDGPGFDAAALGSFGQRKYSRAVVSGSKKRISIGLGSVIMKSIVDAYRGDLNASNRLDESNHAILGAEIYIRLPLI